MDQVKKLMIRKNSSNKFQIIRIVGKLVISGYWGNFLEKYFCFFRISQTNWTC